MVEERLVDMRYNEFNDVWPHAMLYRQLITVQVVLYHSFKQRDVEMILLSQSVDGWVGPQLLVVANHYQVLAPVPSIAIFFILY